MIRTLLFAGFTAVAICISTCVLADDCMECHSDMMKGIAPHEPATMDCMSCHKADHDGAAPFLKKPVNELCFECHNYPSNMNPHYGHPVSGPKDKLHPEKPFNCASCHNPHSANSPVLFRYRYGKDTPYKGERCVVCHYEIIGNKPPTPPWRE